MGLPAKINEELLKVINLNEYDLEQQKSNYDFILKIGKNGKNIVSFFDNDVLEWDIENILDRLDLVTSRWETYDEVEILISILKIYNRNIKIKKLIYE